MPERALHALFEALWVRSRFQHFGTIVGFEHHQIALGEESREPHGRVPEIGCDCDSEGARRDAERNLRRVVWQTERFHDKRAEDHRAARSERAGFDAAPRPPKEPFIVGVERDAKCSRERPRLGRMVPMVVSDEEPERRLGYDQLGVERSHPFRRAGGPDARIQQQALALGFDHEAVAARPGAEDIHTHAPAMVAQGLPAVEGKAAGIGVRPPPSFYDAQAMSEKSLCPQCGHPAPAGARFCAQCGAIVGPSAPTPTLAPAPVEAPKKAPSPVSKKTMMGFGPTATPAPVQIAPKVPTPAPAPAPAAPGGSLRGTMLGLSAGTPGAPPVAPPEVSPAARPHPPRATVLGVALPGIAPLRAGDSGAPAALPTATGAPSYPNESNAAFVPPIVPAPAPLADLPAPSLARFVRRTGVPLVAVLLVAGGLLLGGGLGLFWLSRDRPAITAQLRASPEGADVLGLRCDPASCKNGTSVDIDGARSTFTDGKSDLTLLTLLHIGDNPLALHVDRPGLGRDEVVRLVVPVSFRIRGDLSGISALKPTVAIHVEAAADSVVTVDGKPLALGADGAATYSIDESAATEGPADESRVVAVQVPYSVTAKGAATQTGNVTARFSVAPLRIDVPGTRGVVDRDRILVAGRAAKGAVVTVDGASVSVASDGSFEASIALAAVGERVLRVRAGTSLLSPRTVNVEVKRVASFAQEARAFERLKPLSYDAAMANPSASVGQPVAVEGEVMKARTSGHRSILIVDDRRGCAKGSCLARVSWAQDLAPAPGTVVRAYGRVAPPFAAASGEIVLEVEADFIVPNKR